MALHYFENGSLRQNICNLLDLYIKIITTTSARMNKKRYSI